MGRLEPGLRADLVVLEGEDFRRVPYRPGHNPVIEVVVGGRSFPAEGRPRAPA
ncbi:MAG: hypothetical protein M3245_01085 [Actinomycetota bacterium]|nr:hypothetical protein [Actinomycetota bacterium]